MNHWLELFPNLSSFMFILQRMRNNSQISVFYMQSVSLIFCCNRLVLDIVLIFLFCLFQYFLFLFKNKILQIISPRVTTTSTYTQTEFLYLAFLVSVVQPGFKLTEIYQSLPLKCLDPRHVPPFVFLFFKHTLLSYFLDWLQF